MQERRDSSRKPSSKNLHPEGTWKEGWTVTQEATGEDVDDSCLWGSDVRASPDIPVSLRATRRQSFPLCRQQPICRVRKRTGFDSPVAASNGVVLPKARKDPLLLSRGATAEPRRAGEPRAQCGTQCCSSNACSASGVKPAKKRQNLLLVPRLGKMCEDWMERVESGARSAPLLPLLEDKRGSDKDGVGRGSTELNQPVSLVMFTADKKQSLKLPRSLFTV